LEILNIPQKKGDYRGFVYKLNYLNYLYLIVLCFIYNPIFGGESVDVDGRS